MADQGSHGRHDRFAIADAISGGSIPPTIGTCRACRALHDDLLTFQLAIREAWAPRRERDLRLTVSDAAHLRRRQWRRLLESIGTSRDVLSRPVALSFTGLGLAGLLLTTIPAGSSIGVSGAAAPVEPDKTLIAAETPPSIAGSIDARDAPERADPLPGLSIGLLTIGAAVFAIRHVTRHARNGMR